MLQELMTLQMMMTQITLSWVKPEMSSTIFNLKLYVQ